MKEKDDIKPVAIFSGTIWAAELVKSLLENAEVEAFLIDQNTGTLAPWYTAGGGAGSVKVVVSSLDYETASQIVKEYENNIREKE